MPSKASGDGDGDGLLILKPPPVTLRLGAGVAGAPGETGTAPRPNDSLMEAVVARPACHDTLPALLQWFP